MPVVEGMPSNYRPMWEALSDEKKEAIIRESRMYNMTTPGAVEKFWASRPLNADKIVESKQNQQQVSNQINEARANVISTMKRLGGNF